MKYKLLLLLVAAIVALGIVLIIRSDLKKSKQLDRINSEVKLHEFRAKQFQDSIKTLKSKIVYLNKAVSILAHENDSLAKRDPVIVRQIFNAPKSYTKSHLDSIWHKRYTR